MTVRRIRFNDGLQAPNSNVGSWSVPAREPTSASDTVEMVTGEMMGEPIFIVMLFGVLGVLPIVGLIVQILRDRRGRRRNAQLKCYLCGNSGALLPLHHYRNWNDNFLYCHTCFTRQDRISTLVYLLGAGILIVGLVAWLLAT
jgi:hypothetical protein